MKIKHVKEKKNKIVLKLMCNSHTDRNTCKHRCRKRRTCDAIYFACFHFVSVAQVISIEFVGWRRRRRIISLNEIVVLMTTSWSEWDGTRNADEWIKVEQKKKNEKKIVRRLLYPLISRLFSAVTVSTPARKYHATNERARARTFSRRSVDVVTWT